jgi:polar amino acid transport system substrate-binding protein
MKCFLLLMTFLPSVLWAQDYTVTYGVKGAFAQVNQEIVTRMYEGTGVTPTYVYQPSARMMMATNEGKADAALFRAKGAEVKFPNLVPLPTPHYNISIRAFTNRDLPIEDWASLKGYRIAYISGFLIARNNTTNMDRIETKTLEQAMNLLAANRVDVVIASTASGLEITQQPDKKSLIMMERALATVPLYHYVHKRHAEIVPVLTENLKQLREQGEVDAIIQRVLSF